MMYFLHLVRIWIQRRTGWDHGTCLPTVSISIPGYFFLSQIFILMFSTKHNQHCEKPWVFGIWPMGSGFLPKTQDFWGFLGFCFSSNLGLQREFIQAISKSNYSFKTTKQLSATYMPNLKHQSQKYNSVMHMKEVCALSSILTLTCSILYGM